MNAVLTAAIAELGLDAQVQGLNFVQKADPCIAALDTRAMAESSNGRWAVESLASVRRPAVRRGRQLEVTVSSVGINH